MERLKKLEAELELKRMRTAAEIELKKIDVEAGLNGREIKVVEEVIE